MDGKLKRSKLKGRRKNAVVVGDLESDEPLALTPELLRPVTFLSRTRGSHHHCIALGRWPKEFSTVSTSTTTAPKNRKELQKINE